MKPIASSIEKFLRGYPPETLAQVQQMLDEGRMGPWLLQKYPAAHGVRTDRALYEYVQALKTEHLRGADAVNKVAFDSKLQIVQHALGTHATVSRGEPLHPIPGTPRLTG